MDIFDKYPDIRSTDFVVAFDFKGCYSRLNPEEALSEFDVAIALLGSGLVTNVEGQTAFSGVNLSYVSKLLGRSRRAIEGFIARNPLLVDLVKDLEDEFLDAVEQKHRLAAMSGDLTTQRFFLTTLGKERGYVTRAEATGKGGAPVQVVFSGNDANL